MRLMITATNYVNYFLVNTINMVCYYFYNTEVYHKQITFKNNITKNYEIVTEDTKKTYLSSFMKKPWFVEIENTDVSQDPTKTREIFKAEYITDGFIESFNLSSINGDSIFSKTLTFEDKCKESNVLEARLCGKENTAFKKRFSYGINITDFVKLIMKDDNLYQKEDLDKNILPFILCIFKLQRYTFDNLYISVLMNDTLDIVNIYFV